MKRLTKTTKILLFALLLAVAHLGVIAQEHQFPDNSDIKMGLISENSDNSDNSTNTASSINELCSQPFTLSVVSTVCPGVPIKLKLSGSTNGADYELWDTGDLSGPIDSQDGTGSAIEFTSSVTSNLYYNVKVKNASGCLDGMFILTVAYQVPAPPTISAPTLPVTNISVCAGETTTISPSGSSSNQYKFWKSPTSHHPDDLITSGTMPYTTVFQQYTTSALTAGQVLNFYISKVEGTCESANRLHVTVTGVAPPSNNFSLLGGGTFCSSTTLSVIGHQSGVSYELFRGTQSFGALDGGGSNPPLWPNITTAGTYTVKAKNKDNTCTVVEKTTTVGRYAAPTSSGLSLSGVGTVCESDADANGKHQVVLSGRHNQMIYSIYEGDDHENTTPLASTSPNDNSSNFSFGVGHGSYKIEARNENCSSSALVEVLTFSINEQSLPSTNYTLSGAGTFCGVNSTTLTLSGSQPDVDYWVEVGGSNRPGQPTTAGGPITWTISDVGANTFTVKASPQAGHACDAEEVTIGSATIELIPPPATNFTLSGTASYCTDINSYPITLSGSQPYVTYQLYRNGSPYPSSSWSWTQGPGTGSHTWTVNQGGSYSVKAIAPGCTSGFPIDDSDVVITEEPVLTTYNFSTSGGEFCLGTSALLSLTAYDANADYTLHKDGSNSGILPDNPGAAAPVWTVSAAGNYIVRGSAKSSYATCNQTSSNQISVTFKAAALPYNFAQVGTDQVHCESAGIKLDNSQDGFKYFLYKEVEGAADVLSQEQDLVNGAPGSTGNSIAWTVTEDGIYYVKATSSVCPDVTMAGTANIKIEHVGVYLLTGGGQACSNEGASFRLLDSDPGRSYFLKKGNTIDLNTKRDANGGVVTWDDILAPGSYTVVADGGVCGYIEMTNQSTTVNIDTAPVAPTVQDMIIYDGTIFLQDLEVDVIQPVTNVTYVWYTGTSSTPLPTKNGTETGVLEDFSAGSVDVYVEAISTITGCKSARAKMSVIYSYAIPPPVPTKASSTCNDYLLELTGTPPANIEWYWQGTDDHGRDMETYAKDMTMRAGPGFAKYRVTKNGKYYVRSYDRTNRIWGPELIFLLVTDYQASLQNTPGGCAEISAMLTPDNPLPNGYKNDSPYNLIRSYTVKKAALTMGSEVVAEGDAGNVTLATQYMDGLGRPMQTVSRATSPLNRDMIQASVYDEFGRQTQQFLPYTSDDTDGSIKVSPIVDQASFYGDPNNGHFKDETFFYGLSKLENSPLNRVQLSMAPGDSWVGSNVGVKSEYDLNTSTDDVRIWRIGTNSNEPVSLGAYAEATLNVTITTDEEGHQTKQYTDRSGRVVLKKVEIDGQGEGHSGWLNTYYVYDKYDNLRFVLPPKAVDLLKDQGSPWAWNTDDLKELVFSYTYDTRGRMVTKQVPGTLGVTNLIYDKLDRLVLTQDAEQDQIDQWTFTKYDKLQRPVMTGFLTIPGNRDALQTAADLAEPKSVLTDIANVSSSVSANSIVTGNHQPGFTLYEAKKDIVLLQGFDSESDSEVNFEITTSTADDYTYNQGLYDNAFPDFKVYTEYDLLTINYYDDYNFTDEAYTPPSSAVLIDPTSSDGIAVNAITPVWYENPLGQATGSKVRVLDSPQWLTTVMFYDDRGRVIQALADNHLGGKDINSSQYDFSGKVLRTYTQHHNPLASGNATTDILKHFNYDNSGRLLTVDQDVNNINSLKRLVTNTYNEIGELSNKKLGNATIPLESLTYGYNIRGWLSGINEAYVNAGGLTNYFGMTLNYAAGYEKNYRNGNISGTKWRSRSSTDIRSMGYEYDASNRLKGADYGQGTSWENTAVDFSTAYTYDPNGNLQTLSREGMIVGTKKTIDNLNYGYLANSNRLNYVEDTESIAEGFDNPNGTNVDYGYDHNGNMTLDNNKNITAITYNHLNLPKMVTFTGNRSISYTYDAAGIKLQKQVNDGGNITTTDYVGGFIYEDNALQQFAHEEGRVRLSDGSLVYDYFVKDHLGNTRMTLTEEISVTEYKAAFETGIDAFGKDVGLYEESVFLNVLNTRDPNTPHNTSNVDGITDVGVARLNGSENNRRVGPGKLIAVTAGDQIAVDVDYYHTGGYSSQGTWNSSDMLPLIAGVFGGVSGGTGSGEQEVYDFFNTGEAAVGFVGSQGSASNVKAYLNVLVFDQDFNYVPSGTSYTQVRNSSGYATLSKTVNLDQGGYVYVYLSNESKADFDVFFDDFNVVHTKGHILQEDHYYPFGMNISALSSTAPLSKPNQFKYNGKEEQIEFGLDWYDYGARNYDAQIGRWGQIDPLAIVYHDNSPYNYALNNPVYYKDPDGRQVVSHDEEDQKAILGYLSDQFGSSDLFAFNAKGVLAINKKAFKKAKKGFSHEQSALASGLSEVIMSEDVIIDIKLNKDTDEFTVNVYEPGFAKDENGAFLMENGVPKREGWQQSSFEADINVKNLGGAGLWAPGKMHNTKQAYGFLLMNQKTASEIQSKADGGKLTSPSASSVFMHELLDHGLDLVRNLNVDKSSGQGVENVKYHNLALKNISKGKSPLRNSHYDKK